MQSDPIILPSFTQLPNIEYEVLETQKTQEKIEFYLISEADLFLINAKKITYGNENLLDESGLVVNSPYLYLKKAISHEHDAVIGCQLNLFKDKLLTSNATIEDILKAIPHSEINLRGGFVTYLIDQMDLLSKESIFSDANIFKFDLHPYFDIDFSILVKLINQELINSYKACCKYTNYSPTFTDICIQDKNLRNEFIFFSERNKIEKDIEYLHFVGITKTKQVIDFSITTTSNFSPLFTLDSALIYLSDNKIQLKIHPKTNLIQICTDIKGKILRFINPHDVNYKAFWKVLLYITKGYRCLQSQDFLIVQKKAFDFLITQGFRNKSKKILIELSEKHSNNKDLSIALFINLYTSKFLNKDDLEDIKTNLTSINTWDSNNLFHTLMRNTIPLKDFFSILTFCCYLNIYFAKDHKVKIIKHLDEDFFQIYENYLYCLIPTNSKTYLKELKNSLDNNIENISTVFEEVLNQLVFYKSRELTSVKDPNFDTINSIALALLENKSHKIQTLGFSILLLVYSSIETRWDYRFNEFAPEFFSGCTHVEKEIYTPLFFQIFEKTHFYRTSNDNWLSLLFKSNNSKEAIKLGYGLFLKEHLNDLSILLNLKETDLRKGIIDLFHFLSEIDQNKTLTHYFIEFCKKITLLSIEDLLFIRLKVNLSREAKQFFASHLIAHLKKFEKRFSSIYYESIFYSAKKQLKLTYEFWKKCKTLFNDKENEEVLKCLQKHFYECFERELLSENYLSIKKVLEKTFCEGLWVNIYDLQKYYSIINFVFEVQLDNDEKKLNKVFFSHSSLNITVEDVEKNIKAKSVVFVLNSLIVSIQNNLPSSFEGIFQIVLKHLKKSKERFSLEKHLLENLLAILLVKIKRKRISFQNSTIDLLIATMLNYSRYNFSKVFLDFFKEFATSDHYFKVLDKFIPLTKSDNKQLVEILFHGKQTLKILDFTNVNLLADRLLKKEIDSENLDLYYLEFRDLIDDDNCKKLYLSLLNLDKLGIHEAIYEDLLQKNKLEQEDSITIFNEVLKKISNTDFLLNKLVSLSASTLLHVNYLLEIKNFYQNNLTFFYKKISENSFLFRLFIETYPDDITNDLKNYPNLKLLKIINQFADGKFFEKFALNLKNNIDNVVHTQFLIEEWETFAKKLIENKQISLLEFFIVRIPINENLTTWLKNHVYFLFSNLKSETIYFLIYQATILETKENFLNNDIVINIIDYITKNFSLTNETQTNLIKCLVKNITEQNFKFHSNLFKILLDLKLEKDFFSILFYAKRINFIKQSKFQELLEKAIETFTSSFSNKSFLFQCITLLEGSIKTNLIDKIENTFVTHNFAFDYSLLIVWIERSLPINPILQKKVYHTFKELNCKQSLNILKIIFKKPYISSSELYCIKLLHLTLVKINTETELKAFLLMIKDYLLDIQLDDRKAKKMKHLSKLWQNLLEIIVQKLDFSIYKNRCFIREMSISKIYDKFTCQNYNLNSGIASVSSEICQYSLKNYQLINIFYLKLIVHTAKNDDEFQICYTRFIELNNNCNLIDKKIIYQLLDEIIFLGFSLTARGEPINTDYLLGLIGLNENLPTNLIQFLPFLDNYSLDFKEILLKKLEFFKTSDDYSIKQNIFGFIKNNVNTLSVDPSWFDVFNQQQREELVNKFFTPNSNLPNIQTEILVNPLDQTKIAAKYYIENLSNTIDCEVNPKEFLHVINKTLCNLCQIGIRESDLDKILNFLDILSTKIDTKDQIKNIETELNVQIGFVILEKEGNPLAKKQLFLESIIEGLLLIKPLSKQPQRNSFLLAFIFLYFLIAFKADQSTLKLLVDLSFTHLLASDEKTWDLGTKFGKHHYNLFLSQNAGFPLYISRSEYSFQFQVIYTYFSNINPLNENNDINFLLFCSTFLNEKLGTVVPYDCRNMLPLQMLIFILKKSELTENLTFYKNYFFYAIRVFFFKRNQPKHSLYGDKDLLMPILVLKELDNKFGEVNNECMGYFNYIKILFEKFPLLAIQALYQFIINAYCPNFFKITSLQNFGAHFTVFINFINKIEKPEYKKVIKEKCNLSILKEFIIKMDKLNINTDLETKKMTQQLDKTISDLKK